MKNQKVAMTHPESQFDHYLSGKASEQEVRELKRWLEDPENKAVFQQYKKLHHATAGFRPDRRQQERALSEFSRYMRRGRRSSIRPILRYSAAAVILCLIIWLCIPSRTGLNPEIPQTESEKSQLLAGVTLIREDGSAIRIFDLANEPVHPGVEIDPAGRSINYENLDPASAVISYNTLYVSAGERFTVTLSDGTRVWLNSESSLRYPDRFPDGRRSVTLSGEAYFEVAQDTGRPFTVHTDDVEIEVLGTVFNLQDYREEQGAVMTLVSGSVRISAHGQSLTVSPNQQVICQDGKLTRTNIDPYRYTAWKDGILILENIPFDELLHRLGRWYGKTIHSDIAVSRNELFKGRFDREDLETAMKTLTLNLGLKFTIEDDSVTLYR